jgi:hypothetical protein
VADARLVGGALVRDGELHRAALVVADLDDGAAAHRVDEVARDLVEGGRQVERLAEEAAHLRDDRAAALDLLGAGARQLPGAQLGQLAVAVAHARGVLVQDVLRSLVGERNVDGIDHGGSLSTLFARQGADDTLSAQRRVEMKRWGFASARTGTWTSP